MIIYTVRWLEYNDIKHYKINWISTMGSIDKLEEAIKYCLQIESIDNIKIRQLKIIDKNSSSDYLRIYNNYNERSILVYYRNSRGIDELSFVNSESEIKKFNTLYKKLERKEKLNILLNDEIK